MAVTTKADLKSRFENGDEPNAQDFIDLIDTLVAISTDGTFGDGPTPLKVTDGNQTTLVEQDNILGYATGLSLFGLSSKGLRFTSDSEFFKFKEIEIYGWSFSATDTYIYPSISGITRENVRSISVLIYSDLGTPQGDASVLDTSKLSVTMRSDGSISFFNIDYGTLYYSDLTKLRIRAVITYNPDF